MIIFMFTLLFSVFLLQIYLHFFVLFFFFTFYLLFKAQLGAFHALLAHPYSQFSFNKISLCEQTKKTLTIYCMYMYCADWASIYRKNRAKLRDFYFINILNFHLTFWSLKIRQWSGSLNLFYHFHLNIFSFKIRND